MKKITILLCAFILLLNPVMFSVARADDGLPPETVSETADPSAEQPSEVITETEVPEMTEDPTGSELPSETETTLIIDIEPVESELPSETEDSQVSEEETVLPESEEETPSEVTPAETEIPEEEPEPEVTAAPSEQEKTPEKEEEVQQEEEILSVSSEEQADAVMLAADANEEPFGEEFDQSVLEGATRLTYGLFGAVGDGEVNDYAAIKAAHEYANALYLRSGQMVTVYGESGKTYYISTAEGVNEEKRAPIDVITNVDWQGAKFIIDDFVDNNGDGVNDVPYKWALFDVVSDLKAAGTGAINVTLSKEELAAAGLTALKTSTRNVSQLVKAVHSSSFYERYSFIKNDLDQSTVWAAVVSDSSKRWKRKGTAQAAGGNTCEIITFYQDSGDLLTDIDFNYNDLESISVFPIRNNGISIGNGSFITYTNDQVFITESANSFTRRGIQVRYTGNISFHNISHELSETKHPFVGSYQANKYANLYRGFIDLQNAAYIRLDSIAFTPHTTTTRTGGTSYSGTYDFQADKCAFIYLNRIGYSGKYENSMNSSSKWGVMATNECKGFFIENSVLNRVDAHCGITNLYIKDTILGNKGITVTGQKTFYAENTVFDQAARPIQLRQDYGAHWDGNMYFKDPTFLLPNETAYMIYAANTENWDFGYRSYFPNLYVDGADIQSETEGKIVLLSLSGKLSETRDASKANNLYYFKGNIRFQGIDTFNSISEMKMFDFFFPQDEYNLKLASYGGDNQVKVDLDAKVTVNADLSGTDKKFSLGSVAADYDTPKNRLLSLYRKGNAVINASYEGVSAASVTASEQTVFVEEGRLYLLKYSFAPKYADREVLFQSSDTNIAEVDPATGLIRAKKAGSAEILILTPDGTVRSRVALTVTPAPVKVESLKLNKSSLSVYIGNTATLKATVYPENADNKAVIWKSSKESIATVDANGKITPLSPGTVTITAVSADDEKILAACTVTVKLQKPKITAVFNSSKGADIRFKAVPGADQYVIMRKYGGTWYTLKTMKASEYEKFGSGLRYIDTGVKGQYGKGYIYSVAARKGSKTGDYDTKGLPLYRLKQPTIVSVTVKKGQVTVKWTQEVCQGYEVQYSANNGDTWQKAPQVTDPKTTSQTIKGLQSNTTYVFRIRCQKTNKARGTTWSQFSAWKKCVVK